MKFTSKKYAALSHEKLLEILHYDPDTGAFTWRVNRRLSKAKAGTRAGYIRKSVGYWFVRIEKAQYVASRLAWFYMTGAWPTKEVDHKNRDRTDDSWSNLRECTRSQNQGNTKLGRKNTTGFKGVARKGGKFIARIRIDGKSRDLGWFDTPEDAHAAYCAAGRAVFGEFFNPSGQMPAHARYTASPPRPNASGYKGVHADRQGRWRARLYRGSKNISLGTFKTPEEAHAAYIDALAALGDGE